VTRLVLLIIFFVLPYPTHAAEPDGEEGEIVYLTLGEVLQKAFPEADSVWSETWTPDDDQRKRIERRLGWRLKDRSFEIFQATRENRHMGYAVVDEEIGLYRPITFMVKMGPTGQADGVWIMVYRESRGGEVKRQRFLSQYRGKNVDSPIRLNRDIIGITGATLSVRALNGGVKKMLAVIDVAYSQKP
jgi:FAD:protein FMN transferase